MTSKDKNAAYDSTTPLALLKQQCSHRLFVLSQMQAGQREQFLSWYQGEYSKILSDHENVLTVQQFEQHEVDVTQGHFSALAMPFLGVIELSLDGAEQAAGLIERIGQLHKAEPSALDCATWLYYPVSEKVGRDPLVEQSMLTLAFANAVPGTEFEFREWYCTKHIRHALKVPALVSGQCFELTNFQDPGALTPDYTIIAVYEQEGSPEQMIESFNSLPEDALEFPALDLAPGRFAEWVYRPLTEKISNQ